MNKKYSILGMYYHYDGLWGIYLHITAQIIRAYEKGFIPVVNLKTNGNQYFKDGRALKDNSWEYYFAQPEGIGLDNIKDTKNVIFSNDEETIPQQYSLVPFDMPSVLNDTKKEHPYIRDYVKYLKFSDKTSQYLNDEYKRIIGDEKDILGILCRGTDYKNLRPHLHTIQPEPKDVIKKAEELREKYHYKRIWLATEDAQIYKMFKDKFGDIIIDNNQYMYSGNEKTFLNKVEVNRKDHFYNLGKEYLLSTYILSKCKYLIGGKTAGTLGAYLMSNLFENQEYVYLWDLGRYKIGSPVCYRHFAERILSFKNSFYEDKKWKVITILGFKIKIKRMNKNRG